MPDLRTEAGNTEQARDVLARASATAAELELGTVERRAGGHLTGRLAAF